MALFYSIDDNIAIKINNLARVKCWLECCVSVRAVQVTEGSGGQRFMTLRGVHFSEVKMAADSEKNIMSSTLRTFKVKRIT